MSLAADRVVCTVTVRVALAARATPAFPSYGAQGKKKTNLLALLLSFCPQHSWLKVAKQAKSITSNAEIAAQCCSTLASVGRAVPTTEWTNSCHSWLGRSWPQGHPQCWSRSKRSYL